MSLRTALLSLTGALLLLLTLPTASHAQMHREPEGRSLSITFSSLHLLVLGMLDGTAEVRASNSFSLSAVAGVGIGNSSGYEIGGQASYYPAGDFDHGMQIGGEISYLMMKANNVFRYDFSWVSVGPYIGYKYAAGYGLTFNAQGGLTWLSFSNTRPDTTGAGLPPRTERAPMIGVVARLNLGWSF